MNKQSNTTSALAPTTARAHVLSQEDQVVFSSVNEIIFSNSSKPIQANRMMALIESEVKKTRIDDWYITTHIEEGGKIILGPFTTADDAAMARRYIELKDRVTTHISTYLL